MPKYLLTLFYVFPSFDACLLSNPLASLLLRRYLKPHTCSQNQCHCCELICPSLSTHREQLPPGTCRTASQQPGRLSSSLSIDSRQSLDFLALTETWIHTRQHSQPFPSPTHPGLLAEGCECVCVGGLISPQSGDYLFTHSLTWEELPISVCHRALVPILFTFYHGSHTRGSLEQICV